MKRLTISDEAKAMEQNGFVFQDRHLGECLFLQRGQYTGWIAKKHPDGFWVTIRMANEQDLNTISLRMAHGN